MKQKLNEINRVFWNKVFPKGRSDAKAVSLELVRLQKETIRVFCEETLRFRSIQDAAQSIGILISAPLPKPELMPEPEIIAEPAALEMGIDLPSQPTQPAEPEKPKKRGRKETILPDDGPWPESIKKGFAP